MERARLRELKLLERSLRCKFKNKDLLDRSLTHSSHLSCSQDKEKREGANEELEFLGDAVLGMVAAEYFYRHNPSGGEGKLSKLRARVVNKNVLYRKAHSLELAGYVLVSSSEDKSGGRNRPGLLADVMEALIGALFIDGGFAAVRKFILFFFREELREARHTDEIIDHKSQFQEYAQRRFKTIPRYQVVHASGPDHRKVFTVSVFLDGREEGKGSGLSKKDAEQEAAKKAFKKSQAKGDRK